MKKSDLIKIIRQEVQTGITEIVMPMVKQVEAMRLIINEYVINENSINIKRPTSIKKKNNISVLEEILAETEPMQDDMEIYATRELNEGYTNGNNMSVSQILKETIPFDDHTPQPINMDSLLNKNYSEIVKRAEEKSAQRYG